MITCASGAGAVDTDCSSPEDTSARIARIESNLMPLVIIKGDEHRGYALTERMEY